MSKTFRGSKGPGYDYSGRRIESRVCCHGKDVKIRTHRRERLRAKRQLRNGVEMQCREAF